MGTQAQTFWARCKEYTDNIDLHQDDQSDQELWDEIRDAAHIEFSSEDGACYFWAFDDGSSLGYHECAESNGWMGTEGTDFFAYSVEDTPAATEHFRSVLKEEMDVLEDEYEDAAPEEKEQDAPEEGGGIGGASSAWN